ncbi:MAG: hypothetical protein JNM86_05175 [Phycisphaerae bacterium]|nr:hypothetical protein [Phycisphaerae bacterium]MBN8598096.1 hypothetical protein [Planctomycetota bacterium]
MDSTFDPNQSAAFSAAPEVQPLLAKELTGDLRCARCQYNLRGLSIRARCPECGMSIRGTILAKVDPHASELQPIYFPRLTALGLVVWPLAAILAAACLWWLRASEMAARASPSWVGDGAVLFTLLSGLGAVALIKPHAQIAADGIARAAIGVLLYLPLALAFHIVINRMDSIAPTPFVALGQLSTERSAVRLICDLLMMVLLACLRPNARLFVHRSMLLRSGKVDRQTMLAMVGALAVIAVGDLAHLFGARAAGGIEQIAQVLGTVLIAVGSMFLTIGMVGVLVDIFRILPAVLSAPVSLESVTDGEFSGSMLSTSSSRVP